ncbi:MAG: phage integrase N-terminal SAM-like domain-containing protein, partial [Spirochaetales bacterium]|nr:phage integrase N-terminal SAM-like domain-containing protein [Spirochaetales bacterium]
MDQLRNALRVKHYYYRTGKSYIYRVRRYIYFHNLKHPREMDAYELRAFFNHPAQRENVSASTQNQALNFKYQQQKIKKREPISFSSVCFF